MTLLLLSCSGPPAPQTAAASLAERPEWVGSTAYAPAAPDVVLNEGEGWTGALDGALLVCEVQTGRKRDVEMNPLLAGRARGEPDLLLHFWQDELRVDAFGPDDHARATIGAASVHLQEGEDVRLTLRDRGLLRAVEVDTLVATYDGELPMELAGDHSRAVCRKVPDVLVATRLDESNERADALLDELGLLPADPDRSGALEDKRNEARSAVMSSAGLVGWDHPAVTERTARIALEEAAFDRRVATEARRRATGSEVLVDGERVAAKSPQCSWIGCTLRVHGEGVPLDATWMDAAGQTGGFRQRSAETGWTLVASVDGEAPYTVRTEDVHGEGIFLAVPEG